MAEKFRLFKEQYLNNIVTVDTDWQTLQHGSIACRNTGNFDATWAVNPGWLEVLPYRRSLYLKNQGVDNDNESACNIEIYFNKYDIVTFTPEGCADATTYTGTKIPLSYSTTTELFTVDMTNDTTGFDFITYSALASSDPMLNNHIYVEMKPFGAPHADISDHYYLSSVITDITAVDAVTYTFDVATAAVKTMMINNLTLPKANNRSFHPPTFYQYELDTPTTERGIILGVGESWSGDLTHDICLWWKAGDSASIGASLVIQQLR